MRHDPPNIFFFNLISAAIVAVLFILYLSFNIILFASEFSNAVVVVELIVTLLFSSEG